MPLEQKKTATGGPGTEVIFAEGDRERPREVLWEEGGEEDGEDGEVGRRGRRPLLLGARGPGP